jgi:type II secretory pathway component PulF
MDLDSLIQASLTPLKAALRPLSIAGGLFFLCFLIYWTVSMPFRRREKALLILDLMEVGAIDKIDNNSVYPWQPKFFERKFFRQLQTLFLLISSGASFSASIKGTSLYFPPRILRMIEAGEQLGNVRRILPACKTALEESNSKSRARMNFIPPFILMLFVSAVIPFLAVKIIPQMGHVFEEMEIKNTGITSYFLSNAVGIQNYVNFVVSVIYWMLLGFCFAPRKVIQYFERKGPFTPWTKKRIRRDFSQVLAMSLHAGVSESDAISMSAKATGSEKMIRKGQHAIDELKNGKKLVDSLKSFDRSGELSWRFAMFQNNDHATPCLAGWHESLEARAFKEEQTFAHIISTILILILGTAVGLLAFISFDFLISIIGQSV